MERQTMERLIKERQLNHEKIVEFLNTQISSNDKPYFSKLNTYKSLRGSKDVIDTVDYNEALNMASVLCEVFGIESGSNGVFEFYDLFKSYLLDESKRNAINEIIRL